jgi:hypothetical protein
MMEIGHIEYPTLGGGKRRVIDMSSKPRNRKNSSAAVSGPWDYTIDNTAGTVTIEGGWVFRGKRDPLECDSAVVTVNSGTLASPCWAYAEYITATDTITIITTCLSEPPKSETGILRIPLHTFYMSGASIVHNQQQQYGAIKIDGMFA